MLVKAGVFGRDSGALDFPETPCADGIYLRRFLLICINANEPKFRLGPDLNPRASRYSSTLHSGRPDCFQSFT